VLLVRIAVGVRGPTAVFTAEYKLKRSAFRTRDNARGFNGARFNL
jgi:hypothetical protein